MNNKALIIGIDKYKDCELHSCEKDANDISYLLQENYDGTKNFDVKTLLNEQATRANIRRNLRELFKHNCDIALFYFSGHGYDDENDGFIVSSDFAIDDYGISMPEIIKFVNRSKAKNKNGFEDGDNIIDFLKKKDNFLKPKTQKITKEDLKKNNRCGEILRDYQQYDDYLTGLLMFPTNGDGYKIRRIKGSIKDDMIYAKDSLNGVFGYKLRHEVKSDCSPDWSLFNWDDKEQIKCLIYIQREFMIDDDLSLLIVDLENLVKRCIERDIISPNEVKVYEMIRHGYTNIEISQELGVNKQRISNMVTSIVNKLHREQKKRVVK